MYSYEFELQVLVTYLSSNQKVKYIQDRKEQIRITTCCHIDITSGHLGVTKTIARIKERFMWKGIVEDVKNLVWIDMN